MSPASINSLEQAGAMLGARARERFWRILLPLLVPGLTITLALSFVQAFSVFPSAILLGAPSGPTRVISIAAYQAAFEQYDYSMASAIAMIMAALQVLIVLLLLGAKRAGVYAVPPAPGRAEGDAPRHRLRRPAMGRLRLGAGDLLHREPARR